VIGGKWSHVYGDASVDDVVPADTLRDIADGGRVRVITESYDVTGTITHLPEMKEWPPEGNMWPPEGSLITALSVDEGELLLDPDEGSERLALASMRLNFGDEFVLAIEVVSHE
jgi:hypothetical protein